MNHRLWGTMSALLVLVAVAVALWRLSGFGVPFGQVLATGVQVALPIVVALLLLLALNVGLVRWLNHRAAGRRDGEDK